MVSTLTLSLLILGTLISTNGVNASTSENSMEQPELSFVKQDQNTEPIKSKRVFLSRGWGPGGYEVLGQMSPVMRKFRNPINRLVRKQVSKAKAVVPIVEDNKNDQVDAPYFLPLVSRHLPEPEPVPIQKNVNADINQKPEYRRFHSLFTSSSWSPMGKRSYADDQFDPSTESETSEIDISKILNDFTIRYSEASTPLEKQLVFEEAHSFINDLRDSTDVNPIDPDIVLFLQQLEGFPKSSSEKRSPIFISRGWGASGSSSYKEKASNSNYGPYLRDYSSTYPGITIVNKGPSNAYMDAKKNRYFLNQNLWRSNHFPQFHLFASSNWGPSGR